jgi:hypothetical protein
MGMDDWLDREIDLASFPDARLGARFRGLLKSITDHVGSPIPFACQDWAASKAAYRFFDNPEIDENVVFPVISKSHVPDFPRFRGSSMFCIIRRSFLIIGSSPN